MSGGLMMETQRRHVQKCIEIMHFLTRRYYRKGVVKCLRLFIKISVGLNIRYISAWALLNKLRHHSVRNKEEKALNIRPLSALILLRLWGYISHLLT